MQRKEALELLKLQSEPIQERIIKMAHFANFEKCLREIDDCILNLSNCNKRKIKFIMLHQVQVIIEQYLSDNPLAQRFVIALCNPRIKEIYTRRNEICSILFNQGIHYYEDHLIFRKGYQPYFQVECARGTTFGINFFDT